MNVRTDRDQERASGFHFNPPGLYLLRDYSNEPSCDLAVLSGLLEEILTRHKHLIPGSMNRLMIQWHADLHRATLPRADNPQDETTRR
jgi:hypothetical protein